MLRDVNINVTDGGLSQQGTKGIGVHLKIGASPIVSDNPIIITGNMNYKTIREKLGLSPLADSVMDSIENGSNLIYCLPIAASVDGSSTVPVKTGTSTGTCTVTGKPNNKYDVIILIAETGTLNVAVFKYSLNGGYSYSDEITVPEAGAYVLPGTGLTLTFAAGVVTPNLSFVAGDNFKFTTVAPQLSNQDVLDALDKVRTSIISYEMVHIVGESTKALWAAVAAEAETFATDYKKPLYFIMEARYMLSTEDVGTYVDYLTAEIKNIKSSLVTIVASHSSYVRMDGAVAEINNASIVLGLYSKAKVQQSIGETKTFNIAEDKMLELLPSGIGDYIGWLDDARYLTFRRYDGLANFYVTNARTAAAEDSDYKYGERVRVLNKLRRDTRKEALLQLQSDIDMSDVEGSLQAIAKFIEVPLDEMAKNKEISSGRIVVPEGQDILLSEKLNFIARYVPIGQVREIDVDLGMENPYRN